MSANCDDFEVAVEMRRHGALGDDEARALDAHLATCAACRRFEALGDATARELKVEPRVDDAAWSELRARIEKRARGWVRALALGTVAPLVIGPIVPLLAGFSIHDWPSFMAGLCVAPVFCAVYAVVWRRRADARLRAGADLMPLLRELVDEERAAAYAACALYPIFAGLLLVWAPWHAPAAGLALRLARLILGGASLFGAAYTFGRTIPRLRRERATLRASVS